MIINKEKIVCFVSAIVMVMGLVFAISRWPDSDRGEIVLPEPDQYADNPRFKFPEPHVLSRNFVDQFEENYGGGRDNPFKAPSGTHPVKPSDYPLASPWEKPVGKNIPVPGTFDKPELRPKLFQYDRPEELKSRYESGPAKPSEETAPEPDPAEPANPATPPEPEPEPQPQKPVAEDDEGEESEPSLPSEDEEKKDDKDGEKKKKITKLSWDEWDQMSREEKQDFINQLTEEQKQKLFKELRKRQREKSGQNPRGGRGGRGGR